MRIEPFTIDHYRAMGGDPAHLNAAIVSQISGPAYAMIEGKVVLAIGGVRVQGIGQAWAMLSPEARKHPKDVLRAARQVIAESMAAERLYRVYAEATVDAPAWFEHLGFIRQDNLFVR